VKIMRSTNANAILHEIDVSTPRRQLHELTRSMQAYVHDCDDAVAAAATSAIGSCARQLPEYTSRCIAMLIQLIKDPQGNKPAQV
jgi:hypothetical protein